MVFFLGFWFCKALGKRPPLALHSGVLQLYSKLDGLDWMAGGFENFT
jgi:hypothetical protein